MHANDLLGHALDKVEVDPLAPEKLMCRFHDTRADGIDVVAVGHHFEDGQQRLRQVFGTHHFCERALNQLHRIPAEQHGKEKQDAGNGDDHSDVVICGSHDFGAEVKTSDGTQTRDIVIDDEALPLVEAQLGLLRRGRCGPRIHGLVVDHELEELSVALFAKKQHLRFGVNVGLAGRTVFRCGGEDPDAVLPRPLKRGNI